MAMQGLTTGPDCAGSKDGMTDNAGRPLGSRYRIGELLGRGGMGEVWRGTDETGAAVAVKTLQPQFAEDPAIVQRFVGERHLLTSVQDPHVVRVRDMVAEGSTLAIVMDLVQGVDLRAYLKERGTLSSAEACRIGAQIAYGLSAIHAAKIVHRDVKPENVLLDRTVAPPRALLTDFGVSKLVEEGPEQARTTALAGTPLYLAPELILGVTLGPQADIYSLGIVLYELVCGVAPFTGMAPGAILHAQTTMDPGRPDGLDDRLWNLIAQLVSKNPAQRPGDAAAVGRQLEKLADQLDGRVELTQLITPPPYVPAQPFPFSLGAPAVAATQMATPQQVWPAPPGSAWETPTTLGGLSGVVGYSVPGQAPMPGYPSQPSFSGPGATPRPIGYGSPPNGVSMAAAYPAASAPVDTKRPRQLPVILGGLAVIILAAVVSWMISTREQPIAAPAQVSAAQSADSTPSQTPTPPPTPTLAADTTTGAQDAASLPTSPGAYADGFVRAWGIGDSQDASRYATEAAVTSLFQYDGRGGGSWVRQSSAVLGGRTQVRYVDGTGASLYVVVDTAAAGRGASRAVVGANMEWQNVDNGYQGDPGSGGYDYPDRPAVATGLQTSVGEYADALVRAWGVGDAYAADAYATDGALSIMFAQYGTGGSSWRRTASTSSSATFTNHDGVRLLLGLDPAKVSAGRGDGVHSASFTS